MSGNDYQRRVRPLGSWFEDVFGFRENLMDVDMRVVLEERPGDNVIKVRGREISAGVFDVVSCGMFDGMRERGSAKVFVVDQDVLVLQGLPEFDGATFQVPSGFNCLQFVGPDQTARMGITNYVYDEAPGPSAAIACAGSLLYRNYFCLNPDGSRGQIGREVELLSGTPLRVEHGFVVMTEEEAQVLSEQEFDWDDLTHYRVGVQRMCQVTTTRDEGRVRAIMETDQRVHQVFTGTLRFDSLVVENSFTKRLAKNIISAGYRTCILVAWANALAFPDRAGSNKLVLSTDGVPCDLLVEALRSCMDVIQNCGLDSYIVCHGGLSQMACFLRSVLGEVPIHENKISFICSNSITAP